MRKGKALSFVAFVAAMTNAMVAEANFVQIDFEPLAEDGTGFVKVGTNYSEAGFLITNLDSALATFPGRELLSARSGAPDFYPGSAALFNNVTDGRTELRAQDNSAFDLLSIDLSELCDVPNNMCNTVNSNPPLQSMTSVAFTGYFDGGGMIQQTVNLDYIYGFETVLLPGFVGLTSLTWVNSPDFHQFDNIMVTSGAIHKVSEPITLALLGVGLAGMGLTRRRKKV